jgi:hypothetical protein
MPTWAIAAIAIFLLMGRSKPAPQVYIPPQLPPQLPPPPQPPATTVDRTASDWAAGIQAGASIIGALGNLFGGGSSSSSRNPDEFGVNTTNEPARVVDSRPSSGGGIGGGLGGLFD